MNLTISADEKLIERAREAARARGTTLTELLRGYMEQLSGGLTPQQAADLFIKSTQSHNCRSPEGWKFNRDEAHERGADR